MHFPLCRAQRWRKEKRRVERKWKMERLEEKGRGRNRRNGGMGDSLEEDKNGKMCADCLLVLHMFYITIFR